MNAGYIKDHFWFRKDCKPGSDYDKYIRQLTSYVKMGKNKNDDAADGTTGIAEYMQNNFYIPPVKNRIASGWYDETQLEDYGFSKLEIKRLKAGRKGSQIYIP